MDVGEDNLDIHYGMFNHEYGFISMMLLNMDKKYVYEDKFPKGYICPPSEALSTKGVDLYRFSKNNPLGASDFVPQDKYIVKAKSPEGLCQSCGISVLISLEDIEFTKKAVPLFSRRNVCCARGGEEYGKISHTPSTKNPKHHTLRPYIKSDLTKIFMIIP